MKRLTFLLAAALALLLTPVAAGHGEAGLKAGYHSTVAGLEPNVLGLLATVVGGDDRLRLKNYSGKTVVVTGYEGEPFLRFTTEGVYENVRSPATYLSRERDPSLARVPASADPAATPEWRRIANRAGAVEWHDHRIHWTKRRPPRVVSEQPDEPHSIFDWRIAATADGKPFAINGFLGYVPPPQEQAAKRELSPWLIAGVVAVSLLAFAGLGAGARRSRRAPDSE